MLPIARFGYVLASMMTIAMTCAYASDSTITVSGTDPAVHPGDDFFAYANGDWLHQTLPPSSTGRWNARTEIDEKTRHQIADLLAGTKGSTPNSIARKVSDFFDAWSDGAAIERSGIAPIRAKLAEIDAIDNRLALVRLLGREMPADVDPLNVGIFQSRHVLGMCASQGIHGESDYRAFLVQGGLGLPNRAMYFGETADKVATRELYATYLSKIFKSIGLDRSEARAASVLEFEVDLARTHLPEEASSGERNADNVWSTEDFERLAPGMNWNIFFEASGLNRQSTFVAWQPDALTGLAALVATKPIDVWQDYLRARLVDRNAEVLPEHIASAAASLKASMGIKRTSNRTERAKIATLHWMAPAIGRLYVERYFPVGHRSRVEHIVSEVKSAFRRRVEESTWMASATKNEALSKLDQVHFNVGYPRHWPDFSALIIEDNSPVGNIQRIDAFDRQMTLSRLGKTIDRDDWWIRPQLVGAILLFQQNAYNFPAAFLQPPKFDADASEPSNYGAIGAIVGHELSHFVDTLGADWDSSGAMRHWWSPGDISRFQRHADKLAAQVSQYEPLPGTNTDGSRTQVENVADLAGLEAAFEAHRRAYIGHSAGEVRAADREFFIGFARSWRGMMGEDALKQYLSQDGHTPDRFRVAIVRNLDAWYEAFGVTSERNLYLAPELRVHVW